MNRFSKSFFLDFFRAIMNDNSSWVLDNTTHCFGPSGETLRTTVECMTQSNPEFLKFASLAICFRLAEELFGIRLDVEVVIFILTSIVCIVCFFYCICLYIPKLMRAMCISLKSHDRKEIKNLWNACLRNDDLFTFLAKTADYESKRLLRVKAAFENAQVEEERIFIEDCAQLKRNRLETKTLEIKSDALSQDIHFIA